MKRTVGCSPQSQLGEVMLVLKNPDTRCHLLITGKTVSYTFQAIQKKKGTGATAKEMITSCDQRILVRK